MDRICLSDITMKQQNMTGQRALTFREKIELSKLLDHLGLSVIEVEGIQKKRVDSLRIKAIADAVENSTVAVPVSLFEDNVETVWSALKTAKNPRLQVVSPVSIVQMEYGFHKKPDAVLQAVCDTLKKCSSITNDVEFVALDATRSEAEFLYSLLESAVQNGAKIVTISDDAGMLFPDEFAAFLEDIYTHVPALKTVTLGVAVSNTLALADACAAAAIRVGAREIKVSSNPINSVSLGNLTTLLTNREDVCGVECSVKTTELKRALSKIADLCTAEQSKTSPFDNGVQAETEDILLTCHDGKEAVLRAAKTLGYDLSEEDGNRIWKAFSNIAVHKNNVGAKELDAIIATHAMQVPEAYRLEDYIINSSSVLGATAHIKLRYGDSILEGLSSGDGPIDAAYLAIEQIIGRHYELDDFQIRAVTEGREAMGETITRIRYNGKLYSGRGISTDITSAGIEAYINVLNKIVYEEGTT